MEYLPSKNFIQKAAIGLLLFGGWFYFFGASNDQKIVVINTDAATQSDTKEETIFGSTILGKMFGDTKAINDVGERNDSTASATNAISSTKNNILEDFKKITPREITSFSNATKADYENYGRELVSALKPYGNPELANEGELTIIAISSGDQNLLKKISETANIHMAVAENLQKIKVPDEIMFRHLFLINDIRKISYLDGMMLTTFENPEKVLDVVNKYKLATISFMNSIVDINDFFKEKGITFSEGEKIQIYINSVR